MFRRRGTFARSERCRILFGHHNEIRTSQAWRSYVIDAPEHLSIISMNELYQDWSRLLAEIISAEGRVDYVRLAERRETLDRVIDEFAAVHGAEPVRRRSYGSSGT